MKAVMIISLLMSSSILFAAARTVSPKPIKRSAPAQTAIVYVPVALDSQSSSMVQSETSAQPAQVSPQNPPLKQEKKLSWLPYLMGILANFGQIFLDVHNRPHVATHVSKLVDNVVAMTQEITRQPYSQKEHALVILQLMKHFELLASTLPAPIIQ